MADFTPPPPIPDEEESGAQFSANIHGSPEVPKDAAQELPSQRVLQILDSNRGVDFVNRILYANKYPDRDNGDGSYSTHLMASGEVDGKSIAFPTLFYDEDSNSLYSVKGGMKGALDEALKRGDFVTFDNEKDANAFAEGAYKQGWNKGYRLDFDKNKDAFTPPPPIPDKEESTDSFVPPPPIPDKEDQSSFTPPPPIPDNVDKNSVLGALGRAALTEALPSLAGVAAGGLGAIAGTFTGPAAVAVSPALAVGGGLAGSMGAQKLQDFALKKILPDNVYNQLQTDLRKDEEEHPIASFLGSFLPQLATFKPSIKNVKDAVTFAGRIVSSPSETAQLIKDGSPEAVSQFHNLVGVTLGAGVGAAPPAYQAVQSGDNDDLLKAATALGMGAILNNPTRLGRLLSFENVFNNRISPEEQQLQTAAEEVGPATEQAQKTISNEQEQPQQEPGQVAQTEEVNPNSGEGIERTNLEETQPTGDGLNEQEATHLSMGGATPQEFEVNRTLGATDVFRGLMGTGGEDPSQEAWQRNFERLYPDLEQSDYDLLYQRAQEVSQNIQESGGTKPTPEAVNQVLNPNTDENRLIANTEEPAVSGPSNANTQKALNDLGISWQQNDAGKKSWGTTWDEASRLILDDPQYQDRLINELEDKPRALTDVEQAVVYHRELSLKNQVDATAREFSAAYDSGDAAAIAESQTKFEIQSQELRRIASISSESGGTATARGLAFRAATIKQDYSLGAILDRKRAANGGDLPERDIRESVDQAAEIQKAADEAQEVLAIRDEKSSNEIGERNFNELKKSVKKQLPKTNLGERESIIGRIKNRKENGASIEDNQGIIQRLARNFVAGGIKTRDELVNHVHEEVSKIYPEISKRQVADLISGYGQYRQLSKDAVSAQLRDLKGQLQQVSKLEDIRSKKAPSKTGTERRQPSDEERRLIKQVNDEMRNSGISTSDPERQLRTALDSAKTRLRNEILDLSDQIFKGEKTVNGKSVKLSDEELSTLKNIRDQIKSKYDEVFAPGQKDQVNKALDLTNKLIEEYQRRIESGDLSRKTGKSSSVWSKELGEAKSKLAELRDQLKSLRDAANPKASLEERRLAAYKSRLASRQAYLEGALKKISAGDFNIKPPKPEPLKLDKEAQEKLAQVKRLQQRVEESIVQKQDRERSQAEQLGIATAKWARGSLLSSIGIFTKLAAAAATRIIETPIEEAVAYGISKAIPGIAAKAPRYGKGFNPRAELNAIKGIFIGIKDSWKKLTEGHSDLDVLYGKENPVPQSVVSFWGKIGRWTEYPGRLHGAIKAPVVRNEYERSMTKRLENAAFEGEDVNDLGVQMKHGQLAYQDAMRSIFLQENTLTDAWKRGLSATNKVDKETGKVPLSRQAIGVVANVLVPINTVPTNIVAEGAEHIYGALAGSVKVGKIYRQGIENLGPKEADMVMRQLTKGFIGGTILLGFLAPEIAHKLGLTDQPSSEDVDNFGGFYVRGEKRPENLAAPGTIRIGDVVVDRKYLHSMPGELINFGATMRRVADEFHGNGEVKGLDSGAWAALLGLADAIPFVDAITGVNKLMEPGNTGAKYAGELISSRAIPAAISDIAKNGIPLTGGVLGDVDENGEPVARNTKGEDFWDTVGNNVQSKIPGLRENLPEK